MNAFDHPDQRELLDICDKWDESYPKIWRGIGFSDMNDKFGEVSGRPMLDEDLSLLESGLQEVEKLNRDFLAMAVSRGELLIQNELGINNASASTNGRGHCPSSPRQMGMAARKE